MQTKLPNGKIFKLSATNALTLQAVVDDKTKWANKLSGHSCSVDMYPKTIKNAFDIFGQGHTTVVIVGDDLAYAPNLIEEVAKRTRNTETDLIEIIMNSQNITTQFEESLRRVATRNLRIHVKITNSDEHDEHQEQCSCQKLKHIQQELPREQFTVSCGSGHDINKSEIFIDTIKNDEGIDTIEIRLTNVYVNVSGNVIYTESQSSEIRQERIITSVLKPEDEVLIDIYEFFEIEAYLEESVVGERFGYADFCEPHINFLVTQITKNAKQAFTSNGESTSGESIFNAVCPYDDFEKTARSAVQAIYKAKDSRRPLEAKDIEETGIREYISSRALFIMLNVILPKLNIVERALCDRSESGRIHNYRTTQDTEHYFSELNRTGLEFDISKLGIVYYFTQAAINNAKAYVSKSELIPALTGRKKEMEEIKPHERQS